MKRLILATVIFITGTLGADAQQINKQNENENSFKRQAQSLALKRHEIKTFYSTAYPGDIADGFAFGIVNAVTGNEKSETTTLGMVGIGYRYQINRTIQVGIDLGFSKAKESVYKSKNDKVASKKTDILRFLAIPTVDFSYWRSRNDVVNLYGSAGAGIMFTNRKETTDPKSKAMNLRDFAYQINPIGIRIGGRTVGGFVEAGYGHKGLITAGVSIKL